MSMCNKCGREYKFTVCEFCARENVWDNHPIEMHLRGHFTPRMLKELETYSSKSIKQKVSKIVDAMTATEGSGVYIWHNQPRIRQNCTSHVYICGNNEKSIYPEYI